MSSKSKEDLELAEAKKLAEKENRQSFIDFSVDIKRLFYGNIARNDLETSWEAFEHDFNIDMGLRHE